MLLPSAALWLLRQLSPWCRCSIRLMLCLGCLTLYFCFFFFSSRRRHTRYWRDWSSDVCSSDLDRPSPGSGRALAEAEAADRYRVLGDLVLTYARAARPRDPVLRVPDHTAGGVEIAIPLDPALSPSENAQRYFRRYAKARAVGRALPARIAEVEAEARALRDALVQIGAAATADDLREIQEDLAAAGVLGRRPSPSRIGRGRRAPGRQDRSPPAAGTGPRRFHTADGATILAGRSARENDRITFRDAGPDDLWFHARGMAGAHVILKAGGAPTEASMTAAAQVAAHYSEGRHSPQVAVDWVARKHVRKPRGAGPGAVTYAGERTLLVRPALPEE